MISFIYFLLKHLVQGLFLYGGGILMWLIATVPSAQHIKVAPTLASVVMYDDEGHILATYGHVYGHTIVAKDLPSYIPQAFVAIEDNRFYHHWGVDIWGLMRALKRNYVAQSIRQGGSTITQQLAKNIFQHFGLFSVSDRSLRRKVLEVMMALKLEQYYTKQDILSFYLNRVYFGAGIYGIQAAARRYFGRSVQDLKIYEAATLAGLLQAPSRYAPLYHPDRAKKRAQQVLKAMHTMHAISTQEYEGILLRPCDILPVHHQGSYRYFTDWVYETLPVDREVNASQETLHVYTTLNLRVQGTLTRSLDAMVRAYKTPPQGALVCLSAQGAVHGMVGGTSYGSSVFNRATKAKRQPGSSYKYVLYAAAVEKGWHAEDLISDEPLNLQGWCPQNYHYTSKGDITLAEAFALSVNTAAIRLARDVGLPFLERISQRFGIEETFRDNLTVALGTQEITLLDLTKAMAVIPHKGQRVIPYGIRKICTASGKVLYRSKPCTQTILSTSTVDTMRTLLHGVMTQGTGWRAGMQDAWCGGKTGTSQRAADRWFVGYWHQWVLGVWIGYDQGQTVPPLPSKGSPALHVWAQCMRHIQHYPLPESWNSEVESWEDKG